MADFARIPNSRREYPKTNYAKNNDASYGFLEAFKLQTGHTRGTQSVGYGGAKIDGANNRIVVTNPDDGSSVGMGFIPGTVNEFGFFSLNADGEVVTKILLGTIYMNDPINALNRLQIGKLPDGTYDVAVSNEGDDVEDAFIEE